MPHPDKRFIFPKGIGGFTEIGADIIQGLKGGEEKPIQPTPQATPQELPQDIAPPEISLPEDEAPEGLGSQFLNLLAEREETTEIPVAQEEIAEQPPEPLPQQPIPTHTDAVSKQLIEAGFANTHKNIQKFLENNASSNGLTIDL